MCKGGTCSTRRTGSEFRPAAGSSARGILRERTQNDPIASGKRESLSGALEASRIRTPQSNANCLAQSRTNPRGELPVTPGAGTTLACMRHRHS